MRTTLSTLACGIGIAIGGGASAQDLVHKAPGQGMPVVITHATIHTVSGETIDDGWIQFRDGAITALGTGDRIFTADHIMVDGRGKHVYPGLFIPKTDAGLIEIGTVRQMRDADEVGDFTPEVRACVAVNPDTTVIPVARTNGVLLSCVFPSGGRVPGRASVMRADGWTWEDMTILDDAGLVINWPQVRPRVDWYGASRGQQGDRIQQNLDEIAAFFDRLKAYGAAKAEDPSIPYDQGLEGALGVLPGASPQKPVLIGAGEVDQIISAVTFCAERGLKMVLVGGQDAILVADLLKAHDVPVIVTGVLRVPRRADLPVDDAFTMPSRLTAAGVRVCLATGDDASNDRNLPYHAAKAAAYGLSHEDAVRAITLWPAQILGVADRYGSLEPGKSATLIVTDGDVLEIPTNVELAFIDGRRIDLSNKQTALEAKYRDKYEQIGLERE